MCYGVGNGFWLLAKVRSACWIYFYHCDNLVIWCVVVNILFCVVSSLSFHLLVEIFCS